MALPLAVAAGGVASALYLNAKLHIHNDITVGGLSPTAAIEYVTQSFLADRMLTYHVLEDQATGQNNDNLFLIFEDRSWTYAQFFADLQRVGNWLMKDLGVQKEEMVALNGGNTPEYLLLWFALDGIGSCVAFINNNLTANALIHSIKLSGARYMITDVENKNNTEPHETELETDKVKTIYYSQKSIDNLTDTTPLPQSRRSGIKPDAMRTLIYTSGTTGNPKGTIMLTGRELNTGRAVADHLKLKPGDRMFTCMPLYHGAAHGLCVTPIIHAGATIVLARKFSHKTFWPQVVQHKANILQYVGELCRYLVNAPPGPLDKAHNVQIAWGNGMRPDVWEVFRQRFNIPIVHELYAATDGLGASFNKNEGTFTRNAIGLRGVYWHLMKWGQEQRVKIDVVTEEILRDEKGFAIKCKAGEAGEVVHKMVQGPEAEKAAFAGYYKNPSASDKRKIRDLFQKGDLWFRSGDMMMQDKDGRVYFVDRLGDTFRWRSENVSTNEVADILGQHAQIAECNVYGIQVPRSDGRCGCAAIVPVSPISLATSSAASTFTSPPANAQATPSSSPSPIKVGLDFSSLATHLLANLPRYAVPIFLRIVPELQYTGTMKLQKGKMRAEGVDPAKIDESAALGSGLGAFDDGLVYWLPPASGKGSGGGAGGQVEEKYVPFTRGDWEDIVSGRVKL